MVVSAPNHPGKLFDPPTIKQYPNKSGDFFRGASLSSRALYGENKNRLFKETGTNNIMAVMAMPNTTE